MAGKTLSELLLNKTNDPVWIVDAELNLVEANPAFYALMKKNLSIVKKPWESIFISKFGSDQVQRWKAYYK
ncbi:hypothetical protein SAMN05192553_101732 [Cyclobacterium xiamenense]|uniref:PAS domain-containing protein n=1 Tax=Cyclobacterium xiamenense TaxID=1297121 RepID=A0A1H6UM70_9BACT|nr:PAS domain-containing protein [Cyclobacterium xiamenense]SEI89320.1 hypothetical protein SAMN05192553_101732 [Cyclobacterium xiamenense]